MDCPFEPIVDLNQEPPSVSVELFAASEAARKVRKQAKKTVQHLERIVARLQNKREYDGRLREAHNRRYKRLQRELEALLNQINQHYTGRTATEVHLDGKLEDYTQPLVDLILSLRQPLDTELHTKPSIKPADADKTGKTKSTLKNA